MKTGWLVCFNLIISIICSCSNKKDDTLAQALSKAGKNRAELEAVLDYYSKPADSLKLKAAKYLIANSLYHQSIYGVRRSSYSGIFSVIDTAGFRKGGLDNEQKIKITDSLVQSFSFNADSGQLVTDNTIIKAAYIESNIEFAFKAWYEGPWKKEVSFDDFCEYILPYRVRNEQLQYWRQGFYANYSQLSKNTGTVKLPEVFKKMKDMTESETSLSADFNRHCDVDQNLNDILKGRIGACETVCFYAVSALRSAGLPAALDYIPHWGNYNSSNHHITHLVSHSKKAQLLSNDNDNTRINSWGIIDFSSDFNGNRHVFTRDELPPGLVVQHIKTIPKVYRHMFSANPELKAINNSVSEDFIAPFFKNVNLKDVTGDYLKCGSVNMDIDDRYSSYKLAYLCIFDKSGWKAVAISKIISNNAIFNNIGTNIMYLPAVYEKGRFIPTGKPFWLDSLNTARTISPQLNHVENLSITRKCPMYSYTAYHTEALKGGRFEGSDTKDFLKPVLLYQINYYPFYMNKVVVNAPKSFRYLRYVAPPGGSFEADNIAEVQFFSSDAQGKPLSGQLIGVAGTEKHGIDQAFDNDINTYYENAINKDGWIGLDLGENAEKKVSVIKFCPRNDTNCIMPGQKYELFYWDGHWVSLGMQIAGGYKLNYNKVPRNSLFWLKCIDGGKEERIFTVKNGQQIWW